MSDELVKRLRDVSEWKQIIERHRRITDDPSISYVLKNGTRVHEEDNVIAKLAASLSRALEGAADVALESASRIQTLESRVGVLEGALEPFAAHAAEQLDHYIPPAVAADDATPIWGGSYNDRTEVTVGDFKRARAALAGDAG